MEKFSPVGEKDITRAIVAEFAKQFEEYVESDCIIIGGGPSGLMAGRNLAKAGKKVFIIERNNYLGGGFWVGGYLMNKVTVRHPGERVLDELGIPYQAVSEGLLVADGPHACSKLIASACDSGVKFANMTVFEDLEWIINEGEWPILALCGAMQLVALLHDVPCGPMGRLPEDMADPNPDYRPGMLKEKGYYPINIVRSDALFDGLSQKPVFSQWHYWELKAVPPGFVRLAESELCPIQAIRHETRPVYGTQFHPEEYSEEHPAGKQVLSNFFRISGL